MEGKFILNQDGCRSFDDDGCFLIFGGECQLCTFQDAGWFEDFEDWDESQYIIDSNNNPSFPSPATQEIDGNNWLWLYSPDAGDRAAVARRVSPKGEVCGPGGFTVTLINQYRTFGDLTFPPYITTDDTREGIWKGDQISFSDLPLVGQRITSPGGGSAQPFTAYIFGQIVYADGFDFDWEEERLMLNKIEFTFIPDPGGSGIPVPSSATGEIWMDDQLLGSVTKLSGEFGMPVSSLEDLCEFWCGFSNLRIFSGFAPVLYDDWLVSFCPSLGGQPIVIGNLPDQVSDVGDTISFHTAQVFEDPDGEALFITAQNLPPGLQMDYQTGEVTGDVLPAAGGNIYNVIVRATDPGGLFAETTITWTVNN